EGLVRPDYPEGFAHSDVAGGAMQDHIPTGNGLAVPAQPGVFIAVQNIGAAGVLAGNDVHLIDMIGLSDAVSARVRYDPATNEPRRVGHEVKPVWWRLAHYAAPTAGHSGEVATARRVLRCRPVRNVVRATTAELTPRLFLSNVRRSVEYTRLTIPADPRAAEQKLCR
ncbi:MAG: hypothetical protein Q4F67_11625, partial [Propionibacteriaceae bacterium]|nr:hypothetical protein [Propionibacteriaceae bacterium]